MKKLLSLPKLFKDKATSKRKNVDSYFFNSKIIYDSCFMIDDLIDIELVCRDNKSKSNILKTLN